MQAPSILLQTISQRAPAGAGTLSVGFADSFPRGEAEALRRVGTPQSACGCQLPFQGSLWMVRGFKTFLCEEGGTAKP